MLVPFLHLAKTITHGEKMMNPLNWKFSGTVRMLVFGTVLALGSWYSTAVIAQDDEEEILEEILVVGSQIKGANISEALAVSVISADDIENLGIDSGEELLQLIPENGQNYFGEAENISGGVNSARGDIGAFNLRNIGTGNTLALLNGRRLVNSATFQTEEVGGSFVPVNTANTNAIPVYGIERVEVLRDGASAIYGADAVAGVVNTVLKSDFEGLNIRLKLTAYDNFNANNQGLSVEWGKFFNGGRTNVGVFFDYYKRDRVNAQDDDRWADADLRSRIPADSPFEGSTAFRNTSVNSAYGQYDVVSSVSSTHSLRQNGITDSSGEFETYPLGDERCEYNINKYICGAADGQGTVRRNVNLYRDLRSDLERQSLFININHEFENGMQSFTEISAYLSDTEISRHASASFSSSKLRVGAANYYNPLGPVDSPNRLPASLIGDDVPSGGQALIIDNYRFTEVPRIVENNGDTYRVLHGLRGQWGEWDWESALSWSQSEKSDVTKNRVSNALMQEALNDPTAAAYNPFSGGVDSNIERALVDVRRDSQARLSTFDIKLSNTDLFSLSAGPVGFAGGLELRRESFDDDRDPRLDGTIVFTDSDGDTYPYVSDVVNSSPTPDNSGSRNVSSLFGELQIPVLENLDIQLALRYEDFSDVGTTTVGKFAFGWRPIEQLLFRGSWSESFRAPNLITINEAVLARSNTRTDHTCVYAADNGGDPDQDVIDCRNSIQRTAQGSEDLVPEEATNYSIGMVVEPIESLTFTLDFWLIKKTNTIGLFGEENHTILELLNRIESGTTNCADTVFNPAVLRDAVSDEAAAIYNAAGICPAGDIARIDDQYANLDDRTIEGVDIGIYWEMDTDIGKFNFKYNASLLETFDQDVSGEAARLVSAQQAGTLPENVPIAGFADLIGRNGNQDYKHNMSLSWRHNALGASLNWYRLGDFYQSSLTLSDGTQYKIPTFDSYDITVNYRTDIAGSQTRFTLGIKNITDERAPLADRFFGFFADAHSDYGRYAYLSIKATLF